MAASPFSFHCMICFEEFHPDDRYPVVLPCGHTYVCNLCAERLDKCMECRTSLVITIPRGQPGPPGAAAVSYQRPSASASSWSSARSIRTQPFEPVSNQPSVPLKKRLPMPKNVVLLSLMEATELATEDASKYNTSPRSIAKDAPSRDNDDVVDVEEDEEEKIKAATSLAVSVCGTYAVANKKGLAIYPSRPSNTPNNRYALEKGLGEEDVDTLVRFFHLDHKLDVDSGGDDTSLKRTDTKDEPPVRLSYGDRVQIVSVDGDWAKLARGYGFVRASRTDLVKVGGPLDRSCKLEAMLRSLSSRRKELRREQGQVDDRFVRLMNDLQMSLMNDEDLTVIAGEAFTSSGNDEKEEKKSVDMEFREDESLSQRQREDESVVLKPAQLTRQLTPPMQSSRGFSCFANDVFSTMGADESQGHLTSPDILEALSHPFVAAIERTTTVEEDRPTTLFPAASHPSPSAMRAGARAWRERHGREPSQGVDFRTGLSGHTGLTSMHSHPHEYLRPSRPAGLLRMSNHTGLTMSKPARRLHQSASSSSSAYGTPPREQSIRKEPTGVDRTGTM